jgi:hypothetical protein
MVVVSLKQTRLRGVGSEVDSKNAIIAKKRLKCGTGFATMMVAKMTYGPAGTVGRTMLFEVSMTPLWISLNVGAQANGAQTNILRR